MQTSMITAERKQFGKYLKAIRTEAKFSQGRIANILKYKSAQFISNIENGRALPPLETLAHMAQVYNKPMKSVVGKLANLKMREMFAEASKVARLVVKETSPKKKKTKTKKVKAKKKASKKKAAKPSKKAKGKSGYKPTASKREKLW